MTNVIIYNIINALLLQKYDEGIQMRWRRYEYKQGKGGQL